MGGGQAEGEEHRGEKRRSFTFCVRAALQVKGVGYAHNLHALLRKWAEIWSCDRGIYLVISSPRGDRRVWHSFGWNLLKSCALFPLCRPAEGSSSTVRRVRRKEKSTDDILMLFTGWSLTLLSAFKVSLPLLPLLLGRVCVISVTVAGSVIDMCGWGERSGEPRVISEGNKSGSFSFVL